MPSAKKEKEKKEKKTFIVLCFFECDKISIFGFVQKAT